MHSYKNFTFPLNVYSHILCKDYGSFKYLHYGLFEKEDLDIQRAQQRASDLFFSHLPTPPCRILEVGIGLGTTLAMLAKTGYSVTGITPDENQIRYAKNLHGETLPALCVGLENFTDTQKFDLILFQESAQYIGTVNLFKKALDLLCDDGQIIIMDEMSLYKISPLEPSLPLVDDYISLGKNFGFDLIKQLDLSTQASPTNIYILDAVMRYRDNLMNDLNLSSEQIDGLIQAAKVHLSKYDSGCYGYNLLHFQKHRQIQAHEG